MSGVWAQVDLLVKSRPTPFLLWSAVWKPFHYGEAGLYVILKWFLSHSRHLCKRNAEMYSLGENKALQCKNRRSVVIFLDGMAPINIHKLGPKDKRWGQYFKSSSSFSLVVSLKFLTETLLSSFDVIFLTFFILFYMVSQVIPNCSFPHH